MSIKSCAALIIVALLALASIEGVGHAEAGGPTLGFDIVRKVQGFRTRDKLVAVRLLNDAGDWRIHSDREGFTELMAKLVEAWKTQKPKKFHIRGARIVEISDP